MAMHDDDLTRVDSVVRDSPPHQTDPGDEQSCTRWRVVVVLLLAICNVSLYLSRANISIAVLYMLPKGSPWMKWVLAGFYVGYTLSQIPAGYFASKHGGKAVLAAAVTVWSIATLLCVPALKAGPFLLVVCRFLIGLAEGCNYPAQIALVASWVPAGERTRAWAFLSAGETIGTIGAMLSSPSLKAAYGWPSIFYLSGIFGFVWLAAFAFLASRSPETHKFISAAEREHIVESRLQILSGDGDEEEGEVGFWDVPWRAFFRSRAFIGLLITHFCYNYQYYLALSLGPDFFYTHFNVDISKPSSGIGFYACLPYVVLFCTMNAAGFLADWFHSLKRGGSSHAHDATLVLGGGVKTRLLDDDEQGEPGNDVDAKHVSMTVVRKGMNTAGLLGCAIFFGLLGSHAVQHSGTGKVALRHAVALLTAGIGIGGFATAGYWANYHDLSAKYSSVLIGVGNSIATIPGVIGNLVSGVILGDIHSSHDGGAAAWGLVFTICAIVALVGTLAFLLTASGEQIDFDRKRRKSAA